MMPKHPRRQWIRDDLNSPPGSDYFLSRMASGWRLVAVEWVRESAEEGTFASLEDVPFGMRVAPDCHHLVHDPDEERTLEAIIALMIEGKAFSVIAADLNQQGLKTRAGEPWSEIALFQLVPRIVEIAPHIFSGKEWTPRNFFGPKTSH